MNQVKELENLNKKGKLEYVMKETQEVTVYGSNEKTKQKFTFKNNCLVLNINKQHKNIYTYISIINEQQKQKKHNILSYNIIRHKKHYINTKQNTFPAPLRTLKKQKRENT